MKERPILFSGPMIRAILDSRGSNEARRVHIDDEWLRARFEEGATASEIASMLGCSTYPVKKAMRRLDLRRPAKRRPGRGVGADNPAWKGGRRIRPDGYVEIWTPEGPKLEHRAIVEQHLGRKLASNEVVHHSNESKADNRIENLAPMTQSEHIREHLAEMHAARYGK